MNSPEKNVVELPDSQDYADWLLRHAFPVALGSWRGDGGRGRSPLRWIFFSPAGRMPRDEFIRAVFALILLFLVLYGIVLSLPFSPSAISASGGGRSALAALFCLAIAAYYASFACLCAKRLADAGRPFASRFRLAAFWLVLWVCACVVPGVTGIAWLALLPLAAGLAAALPWPSIAP